MGFLRGILKYSVIYSSVFIINVYVIVSSLLFYCNKVLGVVRK